jgi:hypothetical protein
MAELTSQQQTEFAALRRALSEGDHEMVVASFDILQSLEVPVLPLLDALGRGLWDDEDEGEAYDELIAQVLAGVDEDGIPALATYLMEENGPDILLDLVSDRLQEYGEPAVFASLKAALNDPDERVREGVRDYLSEMAADSPDAEALLDELDDIE